MALVAYLKARQRQWLTREEFFDLRKVVLVDVQVAEGVDELAHFEPADVREHVREQRVGADVEGDAEEGVGRALVELAVERAAALDLELKERVARREVNRVRDA